MNTTCSVCPQEKPSTPLVWCQACGDLLCESCTDRHKRSKHTRNHSLILYQEYQKLPPFILQISPYCIEHKQPLSHFCRHHDQIICNKCLKKSHRKCEDAVHIEDIVHKVKYSVLFEDTFLEIEALSKTITRLAENRCKNLEQLNNMYKEMKKDIENKINSTTHKNEKLSELQTVYNELVSDISKTLRTVQMKKKELCDILNQKEAIKQYTSDFQTFIALKLMEIISNKTNLDLSEMSFREKFLEYSLKCDMTKTNEDNSGEVQFHGDVRVIKGPATVSTHTIDPRYLEAVKEVQTEQPVKLQLKQKIELDKEGWYRGCCTLTSGLIVFSDKYHDKIYIHRQNGSVRSTIEFDSGDGVYDVTSVDDYQVVVSHHKSRSISIIDVDKRFLNQGKIVKRIETDMLVRGLCCRGKYLVCCVPAKGLIKVNINSEKVETVAIDDSVGYNSHVQVSTNIICYTCPGINKVTVLDNQYNVIFTKMTSLHTFNMFKDKTELRSPFDVTIDDHRNIYVTGNDSDNLVMLSRGGKTCHLLLGKYDGLDGPTAVHYDSYTKKLIVVNKRGHVVILSIQ